MTARTEMRFPAGFKWGAAAASYQVEGGIENTDWAEAAREGRVPACGRACDHYHRYEADFDIAKELGHTAHRLSIEWARIEPAEGLFDEREIAHYRKVLAALHARGLKPYVTLWHFTQPLWFVERGGFEHAGSVEIFARYCAYVVSHLSDLCDDFATMNEPNVFASNGWLRGTWPPFRRFAATDLVAITTSGRTHDPKYARGVRPLFLYLRVLKNLARAHNAAYDAIKAVSPRLRVSLVKQVIVFAGNWNPINKLTAWVANYFWTHRFMRRVRKHCDEIGLNYYHYKQFGDGAHHPKTDMDWDVQPGHIYEALMMLARYQKPLYVSEAGLADADDDIRAEYIRKQVEGTWRAIQDGADVHTHLYWSLLDNYEWALGFEKRFGLVAVNYETLERTVRPSAYVYKELIEQSAVVE